MKQGGRNRKKGKKGRVVQADEKMESKEEEIIYWKLIVCLQWARNIEIRKKVLWNIKYM